MNQTCRALLEKKGQADKWCTLVDPFTWTCKSRMTSSNLHTAALCQYGKKKWTIGRGGKRGSGISMLIARHDDDDVPLPLFKSWNISCQLIYHCKVVSLFWIWAQGLNTTSSWSLIKALNQSFYAFIYCPLKQFRMKFKSLKPSAILICFFNQIVYPFFSFFWSWPNSTAGRGCEYNNQDKDNGLNCTSKNDFSSQSFRLLQ